MTPGPHHALERLAAREVRGVALRVVAVRPPQPDEARPLEHLGGELEGHAEGARPRAVAGHLEAGRGRSVCDHCGHGDEGHKRGRGVGQLLRAGILATLWCELLGVNIRDTIG